VLHLRLSPGARQRVPGPDEPLHLRRRHHPGGGGQCLHRRHRHGHLLLQPQGAGQADRGSQGSQRRSGRSLTYGAWLRTTSPTSTSPGCWPCRSCSAACRRPGRRG
jgi:hypothetical protein